MKISIIIPVYNSTLYLKQCVESILAQTYHNFEILLVDDGSTDDSPMLCDEYAQKDDRIVTIHKQNGGTSDARNVGLEKASGDYITFMDNDDYWSDPDALCDIIKVISETEPDVVMHANMVYWQDKNRTVKPSSFDRTLVSGKKRKEAVENLIKAGMLSVTVWTKLVKTSLIREHDLYDKPFYVYRKGHETAQTSQKMKYYMVNDLKNIIIEYTQYAEKYLDQEYRKVFYAYLAYPFAVWMGQAYLIEQNEQIKNDREIMKKYAYLLTYDINPAVRLVHRVYRILGFGLTSRILMLYIKKVYYS